MIYLGLTFFGLVIGSFLNVCIFRVPRSESIVAPRSHCPRCGHVLSWAENVQVLSYVFLRGRCLRCKRRISPVYPMVEILTAGLAVLLYTRYGISALGVTYFTVFSSLIVAAFVDFERQEIPDVITLPGIAAGLLLSFAYPELHGAGSRLDSLTQSFLGMLAGGGSLYLVGFLGEMVFKKEAMGGGDIKLLAMLGAFMGVKLTLVTFFIAPFFGIFSAIYAKLKNKQETIPYGPYLSVAALASLLWGKEIIQFLFPV